MTIEKGFEKISQDRHSQNSSSWISENGDTNLGKEVLLVRVAIDPFKDFGFLVHA